ncbi:MAG: prepilin-type N-terminal cleavage/methylation domain-containing protein [Deltaproteobacteria bacterium]|jgi:type IV pilus modification protein PilV|nr:MAG: prepilin-type N-terminal cleavage/methylation domain-containing protein [Deltaproteobacteria bacterium]
MYSVLHRKDDKSLWQGTSQQGFSLVELLVAILLLTVGLLALAKMQTNAVANNAFGNELTQATFLAQDKMEELRLLNECYLEVIGKPQSTWSTNDQDVVDNYNNQLSDAVANWDESDTDSDTILDQFSWQMGNPDHTNADGLLGIPNPIDVTGAAVANGGFTRTWYVVDDRPVTKAKTVRVEVTWGNGRKVNLDTVLSQ